MFPALTLFAQDNLKSLDDLQQWNKWLIADDRIKTIKTDGVITGFDVDTTHQIAYIMLAEMGKKEKLKPRGRFVAYNMGSEQFMWQKDIQYDDDQFILQDTIPLYSYGNYTLGLSRYTGTNQWFTEGRVEFCAPGKNLGLRIHGYQAQTLAGVDLQTGRNVWMYEGSFIENLESTYLLGDTAIVVSSRGVHYINLQTGKGFSHEGRKDVASGSIGTYIAVGLLFGAVGMAITYGVTNQKIKPSAKRVGSDQSNVVMDKYHLYYGGADELAAFDYKGNMLWRNWLHVGYVSSTKLFMHNDMLYFIYGVRDASMENGEVSGKSRLAKIDPATGEILYDISPGNSNMTYITDFLIRDSSVVIVKNTGISEYSLDDLSIISENLFGDLKQSAGFDRIVAPPYFIYSNGVLENRSETNPDEFYVENKGGMKIAFSPEFEIKSVVRKSDFYTFSQYVGDRMIIKSTTGTLVVNEKNEILNNYRFSGNLQFTKGYYVDWIENQLFMAPAAVFE